MTLWEYAACHAGVARANGAEATAPPTPDEFDAAVLDFARNNPWQQ
jgi:hypothetical protein